MGPLGNYITVDRMGRDPHVQLDESGLSVFQLLRLITRHGSPSVGWPRVCFQRGQEFPGRIQSPDVGNANFYRSWILAIHIQIVMTKVPCFNRPYCRKALRFSSNRKLDRLRIIKYNIVSISLLQLCSLSLAWHVLFT
jgi:hypothetical protein